MLLIIAPSFSAAVYEPRFHRRAAPHASIFTTGPMPRLPMPRRPNHGFLDPHLLPYLAKQLTTPLAGNSSTMPLRYRYCANLPHLTLLQPPRRAIRLRLRTHPSLQLKSISHRLIQPSTQSSCVFTAQQSRLNLPVAM